MSLTQEDHSRICLAPPSFREKAPLVVLNARLVDFGIYFAGMFSRILQSLSSVWATRRQEYQTVPAYGCVSKHSFQSTTAVIQTLVYIAWFPAGMLAKTMFWQISNHFKISPSRTRKYSWARLGNHEDVWGRQMDHTSVRIEVS